MWRYVSGRLVWAAATVLAILIINFLVVRLVPGDPIQAILGEFPAPAEYIARMRVELGLDRPLSVQLWLYLSKLAHGDLGFSFANRLPVLDVLLERAQYTLILMVPALALATVAGILLAMLVAKREGGVTDSVVTGISLFGYSMPVFWLGQILILVFAIQLGWLPASGMRSLRGARTELGAALDLLAHLALPVVGIASYYMAVIARVARASVLQSLHEDFVLTAKSKGLSDRYILWRHILPSALIPIVTVIGYNFGTSLTGAILTEAVFAWPGLGSLFVLAITNRDYPVLQGIFLFAGTAVVLINLITDLLYSLIDPRIRHGGTVRR
jgi:ABC-type dipeptide/oligopeptide/nickel transport system permease component